jgi:hypothetical protein
MTDINHGDLRSVAFESLAASFELDSPLVRVGVVNGALADQPTIPACYGCR